MAGALAVCVAGIGVAGAQSVQQDAAVARQAYFTHPLTDAAPPILFNGFPPSTVCLVAGLVGVPQVCGDLIRSILDPLGLFDGLPLPATPDSQLAQPVVLPGTTPVGMLLGQERYVSLLQFPLPDLPEGERLGSFELVLHQDGLNFAIESPAFREIVLGVISQLEDADPAIFADILADVLAGDLPLIATNVTGIEACPLLEGWNAGDAQDAAMDGTRLPDSDCIRGTTGVFDPATSTWTFDLTFAAQAWTTGDADGEVLANNGIILRPVGAPNLAYGDPDLSTNFLISLADGEAAAAKRPSVRYSTVAAPTSTTSPPTTTPTTAARPPVTSGGGVINRPTTPVVPSQPTTPQASGPITARWDELVSSSSDPDTSPWLLLLLPIAVAGAWSFGSALLARPPLARRRPGALTHLMEKQ